LCGAIELAHLHSALSARDAPRRIDLDRFHRRQIDDHRAVAGRMTREAVAAAAHRQKKIISTGKINCADHIVASGAANDNPGVPIDGLFWSFLQRTRNSRSL